MTAQGDQQQRDQQQANGSSTTQDERNLERYADRLAMPIRQKTAEMQRSGRLRHVIFSGQFSPDLLESLGDTADQIRILSKTREGKDFLRGLLAHRRVMLYFTQPSTRTFLSFTAACQILGITCNEVRDPQTSSETKGETRFDSIRMFSSYFNLIIMRSPIARLAESCAYLMNDLEKTGQRSVPIVNAGSGADEHPTQALLDVYTLQRTFKFENPADSPVSRLDELRGRYGYADLSPGLAGKTYGFAGGGFAYILSNEPVRSLEDLRSKKVWLPEGDLISYEAMKALQLSPVPLPVTDVLTGLQTGLIDIVAIPPVVALALQWHTKVQYVTQIPVLYPMAFLAISERALRRVSDEDKAVIDEVMRDVYARVDAGSWAESENALQGLLSVGIENVEAIDGEVDRIRTSLVKTTTEMAERGMFSQELLNDIQATVSEYRSANGTPAVSGTQE